MNLADKSDNTLCAQIISKLSNYTFIIRLSSSNDKSNIVTNSFGIFDLTDRLGGRNI